MIEEKSKRRPEIDIMKGLLIISVVSGHSGLEYSWLDVFWFHMPAFFILSGYLNKNWDFNFPMVKKRCLRLWIPYICWCILFLPLLPDCNNYVLQILKFMIGGGNSVTSLTYAFWFVNTLLVSLIIYSFFKSKCKTWALWVFLITLWSIIHITNIPNLIHYALPLGIDYAMGGICFIAVGDYVKRGKINHLYIVAIIVVLITCATKQFGLYHYEINMRSMKYVHLILDMIIPISFTVVIYFISLQLNKIKYVSSCLAYIGKSSLTVMFLHILCRFWGLKFGSPSILIFLVGLLLPISIHYILENFKYPRILLLGEKS